MAKKSQFNRNAQAQNFSSWNFEDVVKNASTLSEQAPLNLLIFIMTRQSAEEKAAILEQNNVMFNIHHNIAVKNPNVSSSENDDTSESFHILVNTLQAMPPEQRLRVLKADKAAYCLYDEHYHITGKRTDKDHRRFMNLLDGFSAIEKVVVIDKLIEEIEEDFIDDTDFYLRVRAGLMSRMSPDQKLNYEHS
jgi:hypothetical protein